MSLTIGSLFSGIGGLELGLERAGLGPTLWQVEQDEYCRAVLKKHWPDATRYEDVCNVGRSEGRATLAPVDVICGGFPCQDVSWANATGQGLDGERSGLWSEYARIVREIRPGYVVMENVSALLARGIDAVLGNLAEAGYDAEWYCIPASAVGAPHRRDRVFVVAHSGQVGCEALIPTPARLRQVRRPFLWESFGATDNAIWLADHCLLSGDVDGVPNRMERVAALGNAVVPQVAEVVGRLIMDHATRNDSERAA